MGIRPAICVLGMLRDRDAAAVAEILDGSVQAWYCAGLEGERGRTGAALAREVAGVSGSRRVKEFGDVATALGAALADTTGEDSILVFGSFVSAGQAAVFLNRNC
jgi:dihydrofolate synthase / folylpolyglutamate synthase